MVGLLSTSMNLTISPHTLKMTKRFAKPKLPLKGSEKKRRVTAVSLRGLLVILAFSGDRDHYLFLLCEVLGPFGWTA